MKKIRKPAAGSARRSTEDLTQKAYNALRKMLLFNEIATGQKIHYLDLAEKLHMSPTPVIQALKWLQFQGLLRHESNRGFYLEDLSHDDMEELYQIRIGVELTLLERTMKRLDDEGVERLRAALEAFLEADRKKFLKQRIVKDMGFHMTLASLSGGRTGCLILQHIFDLLYLKYKADLLFPKTGEEDHREIFERVAARDSEGARRVLHRHLSTVAEDVVAQVRINLKEKETLEFG